MSIPNYRFTVPTSNNGILNIPVKQGEAIFVLGANGVGKSTLMHSVYLQNQNNCKRILAHRQTWFQNNSMDLTVSQKQQQEGFMKQRDSDIASRWKDENAQMRSRISIFDLINSENLRARKIAGAFDEGNVELAKRFSSESAPLNAINELFAVSNIPIEIILGDEDQLMASKKGSAPYAITELSDGERNALLICSDVLTAKLNSMIILDEPERHLHRSIISPLLTSLLQKRKDCVFVVSTHDIFLPADQENSSVLLLRNCEWNGKQIKSWEADLINDTNSLPDHIKYDILGSKREILFVEGEDNKSLDRQVYQLIFPDVTVVSQGSCSQVIRAVNGITGTDTLHWIKAYGLIDADDRTEDQIEELNRSGIAALNCYSVESLYYNTEIIRKIADRYGEVSGSGSDILYSQAIENIIPNISSHKERMCSRVCEKAVRTRFSSNLPTYKDIQKREVFESCVDLNQILTAEEKRFDELVSNKDLNGLISRYPVRETNVLSGIVQGLGLTKDRYENSVRKLILDDNETREFFKELLLPLTEMIKSGRTSHIESVL